MDRNTRIALYRELIPELLLDYTRGKHEFGEIESHVVIDRERDHYLMYHAGWQRERRVFGVVLHLDIIDGKIWIQYEGTDRPIAQELVEAGVPREDIVLAFIPRTMREHTDFAVE